MTQRIVDNSALLRLIEIELVNQYKRFISKRLAVAPRNCRFNAWVKMPDGGYNRVCQVPAFNAGAFHKRNDLVTKYSGKPCTTLNYAKNCPLYLHYSGTDEASVIKELTADFIGRLTDPEKRATSFKPLHTLWLLLHEVETVNINWVTRIQLKFIAMAFKKAYHKHLIKRTPVAEKTWNQLMNDFSSLINKSLINSPKE